jgi:vacuolar-type H+-ATPase subunit I/STV1
MSLIKKIDFFTLKRIKDIEKYINEINKVQLIRKQLGGTGNSLLPLIESSNKQIEELSGLIDTLPRRIDKLTNETDKIIEKLGEENKKCQEELIKRKNEINEAKEELRIRRKFIENLMRDQEIALLLTQLNETKPGIKDYYETLTSEIKVQLKTFDNNTIKKIMEQVNITSNNVVELIDIYFLRNIFLQKYFSLLSAFDALDYQVKKDFSKSKDDEERLETIINTTRDGSNSFNIKKLKTILKMYN